MSPDSLTNAPDEVTPSTDAATPAPEPKPESEAEPQSVIIEMTEPQISFDSPPEPAQNPALKLTFAPAPDAPFQSSVTVGIYCEAPDACIYYTLDGSEPDENATPYSPEKILLTQNVTINARAVAANERGPLCSADYIVSKPLWQKHDPLEKVDTTPHEASGNLTAPDGWQQSAASVRGKLHAHRALWREDAFALGCAENAAGSWSIGIVSDGAGSAPLSRVGSNVACQIALGDLMGSLGDIETLSDDINADLQRIKAALIGAAKAALQALHDEAEKREQPLSAFAATLLILVRRAVGEKQLCAALQVGDGAIALDCADGMKLLGAADHGQHSSETRFLTTQGMEDDFTNRVKFSMPADLRATMIVSDGVSDDYFPEDKRLSEVFEVVTPLAKEADDAGAALLHWLGYEKKGSSDDRTLVLSWPGKISAIDVLEAELSDVRDNEAGLPHLSNPGAKPEFQLEGNVSPAQINLEASSESAPTNEAAGLAHPSNLGAEAEFRLEEGASPAPESSEIASADDAATAPALSETETPDGR